MILQTFTSLESCAKANRGVAKFILNTGRQRLMLAKSKLNEKEDTKHVYVNDFLNRETQAYLNNANSLKTVG